MSMMDGFGRNIDNMRISVTQECDLNCFYCHREGEKDSGKWRGNREGKKLGREEMEHTNFNGLMTPQEIEKITEIASKVGIRKLKITGGEPLLRSDIIEIVKKCSSHMNEVSMTTNGVLLKSYTKKLKNAGLARVNVSFDAFEPEAFERITGRDAFHKVKEGVASAIEEGLNPVKLNMVVLRGLNENCIPEAVKFASQTGAILQLIEFEGSREDADSNLFKNYHFKLDKIEEDLERRALERRYRNMHRRKKYILPSENNGHAEVEIVRGMHNSVFCANCTRLRVTSSGELKPCLLRHDNHIDILTPIREGAADKELISLFQKAILSKEPYWRE